jgi:hypothetical protein
MTQLYRSPDYAAALPKMQMYNDLYYGNHDALITPQYLFPHKIESATNGGSILRAARCQRTRYMKLPEMIVSLWISLLFRGQPTLDDIAIKNLDGGEDDIDGKGTSLTTLLRDQVARDLIVFGKVFALTDAYPFQAKNRADERAKGLRPFVEVLSPLSVVDWDMETSDPARIGRFNFLRHEFDLVLPRSSSSEQPIIRRQSSELKRGTTYEVTTYKGQEYNADYLGVVSKVNQSTVNAADPWTLESGPIVTKIPEIPVSYINGETWIDGVCEETLRHYNIRSNRDNILYNQGFDQRFIMGVNKADWPEFAAAMNEYTSVFLPENGNAIKLPASDVAAYERAEQQAIDNVFKVGLNQLYALPGDSRLIPAADSTNAQKDNTIAIVESSIEQLENFAQDILNNYSQFTGRQPGTIDFCKDITEQDITDFVVIWNAFRDEIKGIPTARAATVKQAVERLGLNDKELQEAYKEIDALPPPQQPGDLAARRVDLVTQALSGNRANGVQ